MATEHPKLTEREAESVLVPMWKEITDRYSESGFEQPATVKRLVITSEVHDSCRHFGAARNDGKVVYVAPELVHMPVETILGILAHEAGHVVDLQSPGIYWMRKGHLAVLEALPKRGLQKLLKAWEDRSDDDVEAVADEIAFLAMGVRIGYVGKPGCIVQALGRGKPRPKGLR